MATASIYVLIDPFTKEVRYVGICARYATVTKAEALETQSALLLARYKALLAELMRVNGECDAD